jgi:SET domain-containing protein
LDSRKPRVGLFANRDIEALEEVCFDYKYEVNKQKENINCKCGAKKCKGVLF